MKVLPEDVQENIEGETYTVLPDGKTTVCQLRMCRGYYNAQGMSSCVDPKEFDEEIGKKVAKQHALNDVWQCLGFELARKLSLISRVPPPAGNITFLGSRVRTYVGTKVLHATPCSLHRYNEIRGFKSEEPEKEGYLVEYTDGGQPNVSGFTGYISWSPRDIFEKSYECVGEPPIKDRVARMKDELEQVQGRYERLSNWLNIQMQVIQQEELDDLYQQQSLMGQYIEILKRRIRRADH